MAVLQIVCLLLAVAQLSLAGKMTDPFIVGGERAFIEDHPHSLGLLDMTRGGYICGASIIGRLWAMSAAHCLHSNVPAVQINLYGGSSSRLSGGHLFFAARYILHPSYSRITLDFDVALIEVTVRIKTFSVLSIFQLDVYLLTSPAHQWRDSPMSLQSRSHLHVPQLVAESVQKEPT